MAGYSGTPLARKLGIKPGQHIALLSKPPGYHEFLGPLPDKVKCAGQLSGKLDFIQLFVTSQAELKRRFKDAKRALVAGGSIWISWPKKASGVATDLHENAIRKLGLELGLVDVKVCAVDETWSGLKFVYRLKDQA